MFTKNKKRDLRKTLTYCLLSVAFLTIAFTEGSVIKARMEHNMLAKKAKNIEISNKNIKQENEKLLSNIEQEKSAYNEKLKTMKIAYLTFDDGPSKNTRDILKILKDNNVKATFFVNGHPGLEHLYKEIVAQGHVLANHTFSHDYKNVYTSVENFKADITKLDNYLEKVTGQKPSHVIRFPGGSNNTISHNYGGRGIMRQIVPTMVNDGYVYFDWNVDSTDASAFRQNRDRIVHSVLAESKGQHKAVILMHDTNPKTTTVQALDEVIKKLKEQGFIFEVLSKNSPKTAFANY